jgi:hypothetical protein
LIIDLREKKSKPDKQVNNRDSLGRFKPGFSGNENGKPSGVKDYTTNLMRAFLEAFDKTGGIAGLVEWIQRSPGNRGKFYSMLSKMLPSNVKDGEISPEPIVYLIPDSMLPKKDNATH